MRLIRILPRDKVGGVESALARELMVSQELGIDYRVYFIFESSEKYFDEKYRITFKNFILDTLSVTFNSFKRNRTMPTYYYCSLGYAKLLGLFMCILGFRVIFGVHSAGYSSFRDKFTSSLVRVFGRYFVFDSLNSMESFIPFRPKLIHTVNYHYRGNEISLEKIEPKLNILFVGRISKVKRLDRVYGLLSGLIDKGHYPHFTAVGPIEDDFSQSYLDKILQLSSRFEYKGAMLQSDIEKLYCHHNFIIQPSDREGFGAAVFNAALYGIIPIITPVGEYHRLAPQNTYILFNERNYETIHNIISLLGDECAYKEVSSACQEFAKSIDFFEDDYAKFVIRLKEG